ncbi:unnamed protein product [Prorocentrum cordatum]|uniref:Uncharacterized protein n=1 Tax=Prorocentrum cordatum TaxID=2364126 RepID=A0ABN9TY84_9DINO|nr:unnamed protein product [Polarella glacialis]
MARAMVFLTGATLLHLDVTSATLAVDDVVNIDGCEYASMCADGEGGLECSDGPRPHRPPFGLGDQGPRPVAPDAVQHDAARSGHWARSGRWARSGTSAWTRLTGSTYIDPANLLPDGKTVCSVALHVVTAMPACDACQSCAAVATARVLVDGGRGAPPRAPAGAALLAIAIAALVSALVTGAVVAARRCGASSTLEVRVPAYTETPQAGAPILNGPGEPDEAAPVP